MIILKEVKSKKDQLDFVKFPLQLYKNCPYFAPSLIIEELKNFDKNENPVYKHAWIKQFLAIKNNKVVGRIAALYNENETIMQNKPKMRFGWFDFINDEEVSKVLVTKIEELAKEKNLTTIEGPMGFSNMDKAGMLTFGFDQMTTMISAYNYDYYPKHIEKLGYLKEKEWVEYIFNAPTDISRISKMATIIENKHHLICKQFKTKKDIEPYVNQLFELIEYSYGNLSTYVPLSKQQSEYYKKKYMEFIKPEWIKCIVDTENKMVGFAIILPSYVKALQKANGKLLPFGWLHLLKAQKTNSIGELILIGVIPEYRIKGVTAILFREIYTLIHKIGIKVIESNPILIENKDSISLWTQYNPILHRKRNTFFKKI